MFIQPAITIIPYQDRFHQQVVDLITGIQQNEFSIAVALADQPDLSTIESFYQSNRGNFWCAVTEFDEVVGTIALIDVGEDFGTIRKMFVKAAYRGRKPSIALELISVLENHALRHHIHTLYLGTVPKLEAAQKFYRKQGYSLIDREALPDLFPRMQLDTLFFGKHLVNS